MAFDPDDLDGIRQSNEQAIPKDRIRKKERTPDPDQYTDAQHPMRKVEDHIGGHSFIVDSTPGHRVIERRHGSGTFEQWSEDGTQIKVIVGNAHDHMKEGYVLTIDHNGDILIKGHARVSVEGGAHIEVKGDVDLITTGNMTQLVSGDYNLHVGGNWYTTVGKDEGKTVRGNKNLNVIKNLNTVVNGYANTKVEGKIDTKSGGTNTTKAPLIDLNP